MRRSIINRFFQALPIKVAAAAVLAGSAAQAAGRSDPVEIPFNFKVHGKQLPAGTYRLQKGMTDRLTSLVNVRTGQQVQIMRSLGDETDKDKLVFELRADGYVLKKLS